MKIKVVKHGNGKALALPAAVANNYDWNVGASLELDELTTGVAIHAPKSIAHERKFRKALADVIRIHASTFRELAKR